MQLGCLCEWVASLPMQITLGKNQITKTYNFVHSSTLCITTIVNKLYIFVTIVVNSMAYQ
jgi:hypothetical protein